MTVCLIEMLTEEIPARMQIKAAQDWAVLLREALRSLGVEGGDVRTFITPRRLVAQLTALPSIIPGFSQEKRGPKVGAPPAAMDGFLRSQGIPQEQCVQKGGYWYAVVKTPDRSLTECIPELFRDCLRRLQWPKTMGWPGASQPWVRPVREVFCLVDTHPLFFDIPEFGLTTTHSVEGHRFLAPTPFSPQSFEQYHAGLAERNVILDHHERQDKIAQGFLYLAQDQGLTWRRDRALEEEVAGLTEYPQVFLGKIDSRFASLPESVLTTVMKVHQRYFVFETPTGELALVFGGVANMPPTDTMIHGYERVLKSRLADAEFFYTNDLQQPLEDRLPLLKTLVFHHRLGTIDQKRERLQALAPSPFTQRAAALCKLDLVSEMVGEFPELQGQMGALYAAHEGEELKVVEAIAHHYRPLGPHDVCPSEQTALELALIDKIDSLVGLLGVGEAPSGSKDPFALRRAALGILRLTQNLSPSWGLSVEGWIEKAKALYEAQGVEWIPGFHKDHVLRFLKDRLAHRLKSEGYAAQRVAAVIHAPFVSLDALLAFSLSRVSLLSAFLETPSGIQVEEILKRARGLCAFDAQKEKAPESFSQGSLLDLISMDHLLDPIEQRIYKSLVDSERHISTLLAQENDQEALVVLTQVCLEMVPFFGLKIHHEDPVIRQNRLSLLSSLVKLSSNIADFSSLDL